jgi:hypothetical protein
MEKYVRQVATLQDQVMPRKHFNSDLYCIQNIKNNDPRELVLDFHFGFVSNRRGERLQRNTIYQPKLGHYIR